MNLLFTSDKNYLKHVFEVLRSIAYYNAHHKFDVYIISNDLKEQDLDKYKFYISDIFSFHIINIDDEVLKEAPTSKRYPLVIYYRIFAANFLPPNIDKILYLDPDTIVKGKLDDLYNIDLENKLFAGCTNIKEGLLRFNQIKNGAKKDYLYINTGVLLMNLKEMKKAIIPHEVYEYIHKYKAVLTLPDQDIINALYGNRIMLLDNLIYNLADRTITFYNMNPKNQANLIDIDYVDKNTIIIHYFGRNKPWKENYHGILKGYYEKFRIE